MCIARQIDQHVKKWKENPNIWILNYTLCPLRVIKATFVLDEKDASLTDEQ